MLYPIFGTITGFLSGFFGIGGGTFLVPVLVFFGFDIKEAIGISVMQMLFSSIFGSYLNHKSSLINVKDGLYLGIGGIIGASFSGYVVSILSSQILEFLFLGFVIFAIFRFFITKAQTLEKPKEISNIGLMAIGIPTGIFSISLGVGGALILNPLLVSYLKYPIIKATSMSLFFVIFSSISGFISLASHDHINFKIGGVIGIFSLLGVYLGVALAKKMEPKNHKIAILFMYIVIAIIFADKIFSR